MRQFQVGLLLPALIAIIILLILIDQWYLPVKDLRSFARAKKKKIKLKNMGAPKYHFFFRKK